MKHLVMYMNTSKSKMKTSCMELYTEDNRNFWLYCMLFARHLYSIIVSVSYIDTQSWQNLQQFSIFAAERQGASIISNNALDDQNQKGLKGSILQEDLHKIQK